MNGYISDNCRLCCFHPKELVVGICALCLNEKLVVLASKQSSLHKNFSVKSPLVLTKILALTSLLNRLEIKHQKSHQDCLSSSTSPEDSFISIKFEDNGVASWDKGKMSKMPHNHQCGMPWNDSWDKAKKIKSMMEQSKPRAPLRWRRRIGHLLKFASWKSSRKANMCHMGTKPRRIKGFKMGV